MAWYKPLALRVASLGSGCYNVMKNLMFFKLFGQIEE